MITMEMIDEFRKRTNCSYQEAKLYLERNNGNFVDAIVDFERMHSKIGKESKDSKCKDFFTKAYHTKFVVEHNGSTVLNISVLLLGILILFTLPVLPVILLSLVVALILGCKISIIKPTGKNVEINKILSNVTKNTETDQQENEQNN